MYVSQMRQFLSTYATEISRMCGRILVALAIVSYMRLFFDAHAAVFSGICVSCFVYEFSAFMRDAAAFSQSAYADLIRICDHFYLKTHMWDRSYFMETLFLPKLILLIFYNCTYFSFTFITFCSIIIFNSIGFLFPPQ